MPANRNVVRDQVDHAAEGGGAVERRPGALHHLDPLYVGERHHVPVDPTPVALVRWYAVDEQQHARSEALDETARATDVDLAIQEQHARRFIDGLVHRGHGATLVADSSRSCECLAAVTIVGCSSTGDAGSR